MYSICQGCGVDIVVKSTCECRNNSMQENIQTKDRHYCLENKQVIYNFESKNIWKILFFSVVRINKISNNECTLQGQTFQNIDCCQNRSSDTFDLSNFFQENVREWVFSQKYMSRTCYSNAMGSLLASETADWTSNTLFNIVPRASELKNCLFRKRQGQDNIISLVFFPSVHWLDFQQLIHYVKNYNVLQMSSVYINFYKNTSKTAMETRTTSRK